MLSLRSHLNLKFSINTIYFKFQFSLHTNFVIFFFQNAPHKRPKIGFCFLTPPPPPLLNVQWTLGGAFWNMSTAPNSFPFGVRLSEVLLDLPGHNPCSQSRTLNWPLRSNCFVGRTQALLFHRYPVPTLC